MEGNEKVNIKVGEIELPQLDLSPYVGKKSKIANADVYRSTKFGGGYYVRIETVALDTLTRGDGTEVPLRASKVCGLQEDENGNVGWGEKTKFGQWMKKMNCTTLEQLKGKEVQITKTPPRAEDGKEFLSIG